MPFQHLSTASHRIHSILKHQATMLRSWKIIIEMIKHCSTASRFNKVFKSFLFFFRHLRTVCVSENMESGESSRRNCCANSGCGSYRSSNVLITASLESTRIRQTLWRSDEMLILGAHWKEVEILLLTDGLLMVNLNRISWNYFRFVWADKIV